MQLGGQADLIREAHRGRHSKFEGGVMACAPQVPLGDVTVALGMYLARILGYRLLTLK